MVDLTPATWHHLLATCHLPHLTHLAIHVLYPSSAQVSILDYQDIKDIFDKIPNLASALIHRRQYQRCGSQTNFPRLDPTNML